MWRIWENDTEMRQKEWTFAKPQKRVLVALLECVHRIFIFFFIAQGDYKFKINKEKPSINRIFQCEASSERWLYYLIISIFPLLLYYGKFQEKVFFSHNGCIKILFIVQLLQYKAKYSE